MKKRVIPLLLAVAVLFSLLPISASAATDAGNSIDSAAPIEVNTKYSDSICDGYDIDFFVFTLEQAGTISFTFEHPAVLDQSDYWRLWIFDDKTEEVYYQAFNGTDTSTTTCTVGLPAGTFYLKITGCDERWDGYWKRYSNETYSFKVNYTETAYAEREFNESYDTATEVQTDRFYSGSINDGYDYDYYKFTLEKAGTVSVTFQHPALVSAKDY